MCSLLLVGSSGGVVEWWSGGVQTRDWLPPYCQPAASPVLPSSLSHCLLQAGPPTTATTHSLAPLSSLLSPLSSTTTNNNNNNNSWLASESCCWQFVLVWRDWRGIEGARVPRPDSCPCPPCCHAGAGLQLLSQHHSNTTSNTTTGVTTSQ